MTNNKNEKIKQLLNEISNLLCEEQVQQNQSVHLHVPEVHLEVKSHDEPERMTWYEAMKKFGPDGTDPDWRLPTKEELHQMYLQKDKIPNLTDNWYWSSSENALYNGYAAVERFSDGYQNLFHKVNAFQVRCVRR